MGHVFNVPVTSTLKTCSTADGAAGIFGRLFATGKPLTSRNSWPTHSHCHASLTRATSSTATTGELLRGNSADRQLRRKFDAGGAAKVGQRKPHGACPGGSRDLARRQQQDVHNTRLGSEPRPLTRPLKEMDRLTRTALKSVSTTAGFGRSRLGFLAARCGRSSDSQAESFGWELPKFHVRRRAASPQTTGTGSVLRTWENLDWRDDFQVSAKCKVKSTKCKMPD